jgi:hypothetical protein
MAELTVGGGLGGGLGRRCRMAELTVGGGLGGGLGRQCRVAEWTVTTRTTRTGLTYGQCKLRQLVFLAVHALVERPTAVRR